MTETSLRVEEILNTEGVYSSTTVGCSMYPMLRHRRDMIVILPKTGRLRKYDVPLYRRNGKLILHRIIKVLPQGYVTLGDNLTQTEIVPEEQVIGVLTEFFREGKHHRVTDLSYRIYAHLVVWAAPLRRLWRGLARIIRPKRGR